MKTWVLAFDELEANLSSPSGVREFLKNLQARGDRCVLVTVGEWAWQEKKLQHLNLSLDRTLISPPRDPETKQLLDLPPDVKASTFSSLVKKAEGVPVIVVGDRLDRDIAPAKALGLTTVHMQLLGGKYAAEEPRAPEEVPDCTVTNFLELSELLELLYLAGA